MKQLLIVIDMQNDFINGSLGTKEAEAIVPAVVSKIKAYREEKLDIWFTKDTHEKAYLTTLEGKNLPVEHCIRETDGWELHPEIFALVQPEDKIFEKPTFGSVDLGQAVRDGNFSKVELCGLCTDICVISNCAVIKAFCPETELTVDTSCVAGVTPESSDRALEAMKMLHTKILS
ncbi:MAG: cysteine hydrolase [Clostridia bacterium]|nr:cysteine hydrolase [Clostridia bacterium]